MPSPNELKKRINAINSIRKITKAMELVATSKLRRTKKQFDMTKSYYETTYEVLQKIFSKISDTELSTLNIPIFRKNISKTLFILVNSDLGFCGGYNANCNRFMIKMMNKATDQVYCIGKKAQSFCDSKDLKIYAVQDKIQDDIPVSLIRTITNKIMSGYQANEFDAIKIVYTTFINHGSFQPAFLDILPIDKDKLIAERSKIEGIEAPFSFEPDVVSVITSSIPIYLGATLFGCIIESKVSEQASRKNSMENATSNADEIQAKLSIQYNRIRQSKITTEISEIISGSQ